MEMEIMDVLGYKVTIEGVIGRLADGIWHKEDYLDVRVSFEPYVENVISTFIELPVKNYGKAEFITAIKDEVEKTIPKIEADHRKEQEKRSREDRRQEDLNSLAKQLESMISEASLPE